MRVTAVRLPRARRRVNPVATLRAVTSLLAGALPRSVASADCAQTMPGASAAAIATLRPSWKRTRKMSHGNPSRNVVSASTQQCSATSPSRLWRSVHKQTRFLGNGFLHRPVRESRAFRARAVGLHAGVRAALSDAARMLLGVGVDYSAAARACVDDLDRALESAARAGAQRELVDSRLDRPAIRRHRASQAALTGRLEFDHARFARREVHALVGDQSLAGDRAGDARTRIQLRDFVTGAIRSVGQPRRAR